MTTTEKALIKISQIRAKAKKEQIGATQFELKTETGLPLGSLLAELNKMADDGVVTRHQTVNGTFYKFTNKSFYEGITIEE